MRTFLNGDTVKARNCRRGEKWVTGCIICKTGPMSYNVQVGAQVWIRHVDQISAAGLHVVMDEPDPFDPER